MQEIKTYNPNFKETIKTKVERQLFMKQLGFEITRIDVGVIEGELDITDLHRQHKGFVHGGISAILSDIVAGFAAVSVVQEGDEVVTAEIKVSYYNPAVTDKLFAKGWVEKQGRKMNFCEAQLWEMRNGEKVVVAKATTTMATISKEEIEKAKNRS